MLLALGASCVALIVLMYVSVAVIDAEPIWRRLVFIPESSGSMTLLDVLWKTCTAGACLQSMCVIRPVHNVKCLSDLLVQAIFMLIKIIVATGGQCRSCLSSATLCTPDCRFHLIRASQMLGSYFRPRASSGVAVDIESGETYRLFRWNSRDHHSENTSTSGVDHMRKVRSDLEFAGIAGLTVAQKRLLNLIDAISKLYRIALPSTFWFQYYSAGQTAGMFVPCYLFFKVRRNRLGACLSSTESASMTDSKHCRSARQSFRYFCSLC